MKKLTFKKETIFYRGKPIDCLKLGEYEALWKLKFDPFFACTVGKDSYTLSKVTRQSNGIVYIPWTALKGLDKIKVVRGKKASFRYSIWRKLELSEYMLTAEVTKYDRSGEIKEQELKTA